MIFLSAADISDDHIKYCNVACVIENILLQATALNLGSIYIWGCLRKLRSHQDTLAKLILPEGYEVLSAVAINDWLHQNHCRTAFGALNSHTDLVGSFK